MKGLLKFITCGSVDDGKSTLIGHILYDSKLLYADQEKALCLDSKVGSRGGKIDYSLLLDGLMAEREQGITIDVAYRYFTTDKRSFIVADTPGHEEYTRNMAVGASFADLAIILIDAKQGVLVQTRRHARICALMGIRSFVFAVNKMDLVGYDKAVFNRITDQINQLSQELKLETVQIIPVSATEGDNVTKRSQNTPWYTGSALLEYLETVDISEGEAEQGFYLPVQRVCRPNHTFRGFQGQIEAGSLSVGDTVTALPSGEQARVKSIHVGDKQADSAHKGQPVTVQLDREVDVSRGCVLTIDAQAQLSSHITATLLWMDDTPLTKGKNFFVKLGTRRVPATVTEISYSIDVNSGEHKPAETLSKNELAACTLSFVEPIVVAPFATHKTLGELILIDRITNMTSACGVVETVDSVDEHSDNLRAVLKGQRPLIVTFDSATTPAQTLRDAERLLTLEGRHTYLYEAEASEPVEQIVEHLYNAGLVVLLSTPNPSQRSYPLSIGRQRTALPPTSFATSSVYPPTLPTPRSDVGLPPKPALLGATAPKPLSSFP